MPEQISAVDRAWLMMDRPTNPMMIVGLIVLRDRLRLSSLRRLIAERFLRFDRFRSVPVRDEAGARWVPVEDFDLGDHVLRVALPDPAGRRELEALAGELASAPLNPGRPLWSFHLVDKYDGGSALIVRIHHCYADGIALLQVLLRLADPAPGAAPPEGGGLPSTFPAAGGLLERLLGQLAHGADLVEKGVHYALHPLEAAGAARGALGLAGELAQLGVLLRDDPPTRLKRPLSGVKRIAWAEPLALEEVRTVGRLLGCTVNDVLVATLAGALGRYLDSVGDHTAGLTLRAAVPVNLRPADATPRELGNRFGLVFVELPIGIRHPLERLYAVHAAMQALKGSSQALVTLGLLSIIGSLPAVIEEQAIALFSAKASLVASNLRGPPEPLRLAGVPVTQLLFWVPQAGSIGTGVSMLTYLDAVHFGVMADRQLIPDPEQLVRMIRTEFDRLVFLILLGAGSLLD